MIKINGKVYPDGNSVSVINGQVTIDGVLVEGDEPLTGVVKIEVDGDLKNLTTDASVNCKSVHGNVEAGGSVHCENIKGDADAGGSIHCDNVGGDADAGGSVKCHDVQGKVTAGGAVKIG